MRIIFEPDAVSGCDFLEIILSQKEYYRLINDDVIDEYPMDHGNNLNIQVRVVHEE